METIHKKTYTKLRTEQNKHPKPGVVSGATLKLADKLILLHMFYLFKYKPDDKCNSVNLRKTDNCGFCNNYCKISVICETHIKK